ncbi:MAG: tetratricopeptide repeat protein [Pyrinomonadaceae bacterium]|nr:tetratricopeptide repeat protein [Pyrinomonadaceae bacterium]
METIFDNFKFLLQLYARPQLAMSNIIDNGSWFFGVLMVLAVGFAFQIGVNSRLDKTFGVPRYNPADFRQVDDSQQYAQTFGGRSFDDSEDDENAFENYQYVLRNRRQLPIVGDFGLWFISFNTSFFGLLMSLAIFYVPTTILLLTLFEPIGNFGTLLRRDYGVLLACTTMAWAAAHLPFALVGLALRGVAVDANVLLVLYLASGFWFGVLMVFALRTVFGASYKSAVATICFSWFSINIGGRIFGYISPYLFSPFLLFYAWFFLRGEAKSFGQSFRSRQNFKRFLNNATINPRDSDAQIQLGLLYKQRRQNAEAIKHFEKAVAIDNKEIEANYELGKMRREQEDFQMALNHFSIVAEQDDKYAQSEIWREIGATYYEAKSYEQARQFLEKYVERRDFDAEGLYYLGATLKAQGEKDAAREMFRRCIESVQTSPDYKRGRARKWSKLARKQTVAL